MTRKDFEKVLHADIKKDLIISSDKFSDTTAWEKNQGWEITNQLGLLEISQDALKKSMVIKNPAGDVNE